MYLEIIKLMKDKGVKFDAGLTQNELEKKYMKFIRLNFLFL